MVNVYRGVKIYRSGVAMEAFEYTSTYMLIFPNNLILALKIAIQILMSNPVIMYWIFNMENEFILITCISEWISEFSTWQ